MLKHYLFLLSLLSSPVFADSPPSNTPEFSVRGLADFRYQNSASEGGWNDHGLGKFRFGGDNDRVLVNEAAIVLQSRLWEWSGTITAKYAHDQDNPVDLTEAFLQYRPVGTQRWRFGLRAGMFFPPISLENTGLAWSSPYTLTSSAINSWVGEELRTFGIEAHLNYRTERNDRIDAFAAGLANNDTAGTLLAWRGWNLNDYEATLNDRLPLPDGTGIARFFPWQAKLTEPFVEVDGRLGYYAGINVERPELGKFRLLYYDNQADPTRIEYGQYGWHTRFWSLGLKLDLPWQLTLIGQGISGRTTMGWPRQGVWPADVGFWASSLLVSKTFDRHRVSLRYEHFGTDEYGFMPEDNNFEQGQAWTANYNLTLAERHQLNIEMTYIDSRRPARGLLQQSTTQEELLWQIGYRLFF